MGRFETAAEFYAHREPYPPELFAELAHRLALAGTERLLDVGCGPAPIAIGFAPYFAEAVALDPEDAMLAVARAEIANAAKRSIRLVKSRLEDFSEPGIFDVATIGRGLHWLDREGSIAVLDRIARSVIIAGSFTAKDGNAWLEPYRATWLSFTTEPLERYHVDVPAWFSASRFRFAFDVRVRARHRVTMDSMIARSLSYSVTSPAVLGERRAEFERRIADTLQPFATSDGRIEEEVEATASVFCADSV
jgi:SAM-dependent methyltransferase